MPTVNWGIPVWSLIYGGIAVMVWAVADIFAMLTFLSGLAVAVLALAAADWMTRERPPRRRIQP